MIFEKKIVIIITQFCNKYTRILTIFRMQCFASNYNRLPLPGCKYASTYYIYIYYIAYKLNLQKVYNIKDILMVLH